MNRRRASIRLAELAQGLRGCALGMALGLALPAGLAVAQGNPFAPVRYVNNLAISQYEYDQRLLFMQVLRQPGDLPTEAMKALIEDRLRSSVAKQFDVKVSPEQVKAGMEEFASRANLTADQFVQAIAQGGVDPQTFRDFVEAGLVWREIVRSKFGSTIKITDAEVDRALASYLPMSAMRVLLSEIVLPASGADRGPALVKARKLRQQLTAGADFAALARENSASPSAGGGGDIDWKRLSELPNDAAVAVRSLAAGEVSAPVLLDDKVVIYKMRELATDPVGKPAVPQVDYAQFLIPDGPGAEAEAAKLRGEVDTCDDLYGLAKGLPADRLLRETKAQNALPADIAGALITMDAGETSAAIRRGGWRVVLMLCSRGAAATDHPTRDEVRLQLTNMRLASSADVYLEELRSEAIIREP